MEDMLNLVTDYIKLKARNKYLEEENTRLKKLLEESDTEMAMREIGRLKSKEDMEMKLGTSVKGEEIIVFDGSVLNDNVVTVVAEISNDKMYPIRLYNYDSEITLEDIKAMCETEGYEEGIITVIVENPFEIVIYQYGNYADDMWYIRVKEWLR